MSKIRNEKYSSRLKKLSFGLINTLTDICLFTVFFYLQGYKIGYGKRSIGEAINKAVHLTKITNTNNLNRLIYKLKHKGYLEKKEDYLQITRLGMQRLRGILPFYEEKRPWDGRLYLITYDIPENRKKERNYLRNLLERLGCGLLQKSVWMTPYNPKQIIADFVKERKLYGLVLVSELRAGSGIGGKDIYTVMDKVFKLNELNNQYKKFVEMVNNKHLIGVKLLTAYLSILKKDPKAPFELLPPGWWGKKAYYYFKKEVKRLKSKG